MVKIFGRLRSTKRGVSLECLTFQQRYGSPWYVLWEMGEKINLRFIKHGFEFTEIWSHEEVEKRSQTPKPFDINRMDCDKAATWGFPDYL